MATSRPALAAVQLNSPSPTPTKEATKAAAARYESTGEANLAITAFAAPDATTACSSSAAAYSSSGGQGGEREHDPSWPE